MVDVDLSTWKGLVLTAFILAVLIVFLFSPAGFITFAYLTLALAIVFVLLYYLGVNVDRVLRNLLT